MPELPQAPAREPTPAPRVFVVGSLNMDLVVRCERLPVPGETLPDGSFATHPGGKGANQAIAAARLGAHVQLTGAVGADDFGTRLKEAVERDAVGTEHVHATANAPSGIALITVDRAAENTIVVAAGANESLTPADIDAAAADWQAGDTLLLQLEIPLPTVVHAATAGAAKGVRVVLNAAPARALPTELVAATDLLIVNETEARALTGGTANATATELLAGLASLGAHHVVLTRGPDGALLTSAAAPHEIVRESAFPVTPVDTVGAGDAFVAALATGLTEGREPARALRFACAAGALATTRPGAQSALPTRAEVEQLLQDRASLRPDQSPTP